MYLYFCNFFFFFLKPYSIFLSHTNFIIRLCYYNYPNRFFIITKMLYVKKKKSHKLLLANTHTDLKLLEKSNFIHFRPI